MPPPAAFRQAPPNGANDPARRIPKLPPFAPGTDLAEEPAGYTDLASAFRHRRSRPTDGTGGDASPRPSRRVPAPRASSPASRSRSRRVELAPALPDRPAR